MISSSSNSVYGLKMQWTPEHSQWAEQHFDISSTTRSPAHKAEAYRAAPAHLQRSYQYAWANDDISALTASNLLKKYAEKYSGILEMASSYPEGRKGESDPWQEGVYPMSCIPEGLPIRKGGVAAACEVVSGLCSSPGLASSTLSEPSYSSSSSVPPQDYGPAYGGSYLQSTPHPGLSGYSYPAQNSVGPGYSPGGAPPTSYLSSGIAAPTPLPPSSALPAYPYQNPSIAPSLNTFKRKAFYMASQADMEPPYGNGNFGYTRSSAESPMYRGPDRNNGGSSAGFEKSSLPFNSHKESQRKYGSQGAPLTPPAYVSSTLGGSRSADSLSSFTSPPLSEQGTEDHRIHLSAEEQLKSCDPQLLEMVTSEVIQCGPPVDWNDIAGLEPAKATLKEEVLWPILRPDMFSSLGRSSRCVLLFGPRGSGRTLLSRCLAGQMGAQFLQLSGSMLATKWLVDGREIIRASFLLARCRQPSVLLVSEVDMLLSAHLSEESPINRLKGELLTQLDSLLCGSGGDGGSQVLVVCSTSRPQDMDETLRRYFARRVLVPLPDATARHQIINSVLVQCQHKYCMSEEELALLVQRTEGFSGLDLARLFQEALSLVSAQGMDMPTMMPRAQIRPLTYQDIDTVCCKFQSSISQKEIDTYTEWNKMFGCNQ